MRALVTGGAGFIGSHLCDLLIESGHEVVCMDNLFTSRRSNLARVMDHSRFEFWRWDVCDPFHVECDRIYHLACPASPVQYRRNPVRTIKTAMLGTLNALECARDTGARMLISSTSEVYGDPDVHPQREDYYGNVNPVGERACYDDKTEILTELGWVLFSKLKKGVKVATLNGSHQVEYHVPDEYMGYQFAGDVISFQNRKMDLVVTPDHRMYVRGKTGKLQFKTAGSMGYGRSWKAITGASFVCPDRPLMKFPVSLHRLKPELDSVSMDDWLEFLGYYVSEGCVYSRAKTKTVNGKIYPVTDYMVLIAQVKKSVRAKMEACFQRLGLRACGKNHHQYRISSKPLYNFLKPLGKSGSKRLPREYLDLSVRQSLILLNALLDGDGIRRKAHSTYYSMSKGLADDVQELALRCGFAANIGRSSRGLYHVYIRDPIEASFPLSRRQKYSGKVYCVNVQNHVICVRRNGKAIWCGNCYDEGKRVGEALAVSWGAQYGTDVRIARIFNTYGPRMASDDGRMVPNFILQAQGGKPITVYGDGKQTRSWCYVNDTVAGLAKLMEHDWPDPGPKVVNIGNPDEKTVLEIAKRIIDASGSSSDVVFKELPQDDPRRRCPDITKAKEVLGWSPAVPLDLGLELTVNWFSGLNRVHGRIPEP